MAELGWNSGSLVLVPGCLTTMLYSLFNEGRNQNFILMHLSIYQVSCSIRCLCQLNAYLRIISEEKILLFLHIFVERRMSSQVTSRKDCYLWSVWTVRRFSGVCVCVCSPTKASKRDTASLAGVKMWLFRNIKGNPRRDETSGSAVSARLLSPALLIPYWP